NRWANSQTGHRHRAAELAYNRPGTMWRTCEVLHLMNLSAIQQGLQTFIREFDSPPRLQQNNAQYAEAIGLIALVWFIFVHPRNPKLNVFNGQGCLKSSYE